MLNTKQINAIFALYPTVVRFTDEKAYNDQSERVDYNIILVNEQVGKTDCKQKASELLYATDWTTIPDVADPANSPYLANQADFIAYRNQVRQLAVNPVVNPIFPTKPTEVWA